MKRGIDSESNLLVMTGRFGESAMKTVFGVPYLPVLLKETRAAYLYMLQAHQGELDINHRGATDTLARSKAWVWILSHLSCQV